MINQEKRSELFKWKHSETVKGIQSILKNFVYILIVIGVVLFCFSISKAEQFNIKLSKYEQKQVIKYSNKYKSYLNVQKRIQLNKKDFIWIQNKLEEANLSKDFAWITVVESGFNPKTTHRIHCGLWQHSLSTGKKFGGKSITRKDLFNLETSTQISINYLLYLKEAFNNNHRLMLYAYNYGTPRIQNLVKKYGENFSPKYLPSITKNYIAKMYASKNVFLETINVDN